MTLTIGLKISLTIIEIQTERYDCYSPAWKEVWKGISNISEKEEKLVKTEPKCALRDKVNNQKHINGRSMYMMRPAVAPFTGASVERLFRFTSQPKSQTPPLFDPRDRVPVRH